MAEPTIYEALRDALRDEAPVVMATVTAGPNPGAKLAGPSFDEWLAAA